MNSATRQQLIELNQRFYQCYADSFDGTRQRPWPGWQQLLATLELGEPTGPFHCLDVGCGNARLASHLHARLGDRLKYLGIDGSDRLLAAASRRLTDEGIEHRLLEHQLDGRPIEPQVLTANQHLVAAFGVYHHLPGRQQRRAWLADLGRFVLPSVGRLAVTLWRPPEDARAAARSIDWRSHNAERTAQGEPPLDFAQLEAGDHLLAWQGQTSTPRYCHFATDDEVAELERIDGLRLIERFTADGRSGGDNLYLVFAPSRSKQ